MGNKTRTSLQTLLIIFLSSHIAFAQPVYKARMSLLCDALPLPPSTMEQAYQRSYPNSIHTLEIDRYYEGYIKQLRDLDQAIKGRDEENKKKLQTAMPVKLADEEMEEMADDMEKIEKIVDKHWVFLKKGQHTNPSGELQALINTEKEILSNKNMANEYKEMSETDKKDFLIYYIMEHKGAFDKLVKANANITVAPLNSKRLEEMMALYKEIDGNMTPLYNMLPPHALKNKFKVKHEALDKAADKERKAVRLVGGEGFDKIPDPIAIEKIRKKTEAAHYQLGQEELKEARAYLADFIAKFKKAIAPLDNYLEANKFELKDTPGQHTKIAEIQSGVLLRLEEVCRYCKDATSKAAGYVKGRSIALR